MLRHQHLPHLEVAFGRPLEAVASVTAGLRMMSRFVSSALRYRSQAPFVDQLLGEIGLSSDNIHRTHTMQDLSKVVYSEPNAPDSKAPKAKSDGKGKPAGKTPAA